LARRDAALADQSVSQESWTTFVEAVKAGEFIHRQR
jgi:hypothetical protein